MSLITQIASFATRVATEIKGKQATLVSGTNIKTIGGVTILGAGDIAVGGGGIWNDLSGSYVSANTFTYTGGSDKTAKLDQLSLFTCTDSAGTTRKTGFILSSVNSYGTVTATIVGDSLAAGDKDFKVAYNRKIEDYQKDIKIPGQVTADISYSQGWWHQDTKVDSYLICVDFSAWTAAAGAGSALTMNIYKNTTALFGTAPDLTTNKVLRHQIPTTKTISATEDISLRIMSCGGATNFAADFQARLYIVPQAIFTAF